MTLPRFDLVKSKKNEGWDLNAAGGVTKATFATKEEALQGGALEKALGVEKATVRIHTEIGGIEEERTFPRSADPRKSPG